MSVRTSSDSSSRSNIDIFERDFKAPIAAKSISVKSASPTSSTELEVPASHSRSITEESLLDGQEQHEVAQGRLDTDRISSRQHSRVTPPASIGRESPLLFAASFEKEGIQHKYAIVTPLPRFTMSQPPKALPNPIKSISTPLTQPSSNKPVHPPSLIHHPHSISIPRTNKQPTSVQASSASSPKEPESPTSENTGRWTAEEHRLFLQGLEEHGKGWKKIASLIQTRTVVQIRTHAQKYFQKLAKARANGEVEDEKILPSNPSTSTNVVSMRTVAPGNMSLGTDSVSMAAAAGQIGTGSIPPPRKRRGGTKRRAIGSVVRSSVREGRTVKRQKMLEAQNKGSNALSVPNPLPSISKLLDPYVMVPPVLGGDDKAKKRMRGRQQLVNTATHGTLPIAALEDAVFRLLTPAPGATSYSSAHTQPPQNSFIVDPLVPNSVKISAPYGQGQAASGIVPNSSPTCVTDMSGFPSWVDAKNPPAWYNNGEDIDKLLEDAEDLNWLCDTGDLDETYPPAVAATAAAVVDEPTLDFEPTPVNMNYDYAYDPANTHAMAQESMDPTLVNNAVTHPSVESLSFLVDSPKEGIDEISTFLEGQQPEDAALTYSSSQAAIEAGPVVLSNVESQHLMSFPDLDIGDEQVFVSELLDNSKDSALSFSKWGSQTGVADMVEEDLEC